MKSDTTCGLLIADLHLWHKAPASRVTDDWFADMERSLSQLRTLQAENGAPVIAGGDIVHRYDATPELINFAIDKMPVIYSVIGNHDTPHHDVKGLHKSAYQTLVKAGKIVPLPPGKIVEATGDKTPLRLFGFPWGIPLRPNKKRCDLSVDVLVAHKTVWREGKGFPGAPEDGRIDRLEDVLRGYDVALFGDVHQPFKCRVGDCIAYNAGCFIQRSVAEKDYRPSVGLLHDDPEKGVWIERHYLDCSLDKWAESDDIVAANPDNPASEELLDALSKLGDAAVDFSEAVRRGMDAEDLPASVRKLVMDAMKETKK